MIADFFFQIILKVVIKLQSLLQYGLQNLQKNDLLIRTYFV